MRLANRWWLLLIALGLVRGLLYSVLLPPWQQPDEPLHYEYARLIYEKRRLVKWGDSIPEVEREILTSMGRFDFWRTGRYQQRGGTFAEVWGVSPHQLHQPPLAYVMYSGLVRLAPEDTAMQLLLMRVLSVLLSTLTVIAAIIAGASFSDVNPVLAWSIPAFVVLLPTRSALGGAVNNDLLAEAAVSLTLALWLLALRSGLSTPLAGGLVAFTIVALLAKRTGLVLLAVHVVAVALYLRVHHRGIVSKRSAVYVVGVFALVFGLFVWLGRNTLAWLSQQAPATAEWLIKIYFFLPSKQFPFSVDQPYLSAEAFRRYVQYALFLFDTFWGRFAWFQVKWPSGLYAVAAVLSLMSLLGLALLGSRLVRGSYRELTGQRAGLWLFVFSVAAMLAIVYANEIRRWDLGWGGWPQARYLFVVIVPIATFFVLGWSELVPQRFRSRWVFGLLCLLLLLDAYSQIFVIIPYFYG